MHLKIEEVLKIEGFQKTSAEKLMKSLQSVRDNTLCADLMSATNVFGRGLGSRKIKPILEMYPDILSKRRIPKIEEIVKVEGIASKTAALFIDNLQDFFNLIDEMDIPCRLEKPKKAKAAPKPAKEEAPKQQGPKKSFTNMTVVFTGFRNKEWEEMIESNGGHVTTSVSKKTSLVVALNPEDNTGKTAKANDLGVRVISREDFEKEYI